MDSAGLFILVLILFLQIAKQLIQKIYEKKINVTLLYQIGKALRTNLRTHRNISIDAQLIIPRCNESEAKAGNGGENVFGSILTITGVFAIIIYFQ